MNNKNEYLSNECVAGLVGHLADLVKDKPFAHEYTISTGGKNSSWIKFNGGVVWKCNTLTSAFQQYYWEKNGFSQNNITLEKLADSLKNAIKDKNEKHLLSVCLNVLEWGGVTNGAYSVARLYSNGTLSDTLKNNLVVLTPNPETPLNLKSFNDKSFIMNASFTKIYSLLSDQPFIIYDSRVAAALSLIIKKYWLGIRIDNQDLPEALQIVCLEGRASKASRCACDKELGINFQISKSNDAKHALWNVRSNWLIEAALIKANIPNKEIIAKMRELEAALFMIGYDVAEI